MRMLGIVWVPHPDIRCPERHLFTDLGFAAEEAENLRVRADLMVAIKKLIRRKVGPSKRRPGI